jgi:hypothetical protein
VTFTDGGMGCWCILIQAWISSSSVDQGQDPKSDQDPSSGFLIRGSGAQSFFNRKSRRFFQSFTDINDAIKPLKGTV